MSEANRGCRDHSHIVQYYLMSTRSHANILHAKENKQRMNHSEVRMWIILKGRREYSFRRQHTIHDYIVDFCSSKKKLVIEVDGISHEKRSTADNERDALLQSLGFQVLRFVGIVPFPDEKVSMHVWGAIERFCRSDEKRLVVWI